MHRLTITSLQNVRIKSFVRLQDRRERRETGLMLVEGYHELLLAHNAGLRLRSLVICSPMIREGEEGFFKDIEAKGIEILEVTKSVMERLSYRENPDAWLGVAEIPHCGLNDLAAREGPELILLAENLEKPGNLGAILRSADAAGATAVIVCEGRTDVYNPNVVRASKGTLFTVPVVECGNREARDWLRSRNVAILAATPDDAVVHWKTDFKKSVAIAVGAEKEGLSHFWMDSADGHVMIPMCGKANSLNVAQAATLILYEALRQRS